MRLYAGMSDDFIRDTIRNHIAERLREAFFAYYRYQPSRGEVNSWRNSLRAMKDVLDIASLHDHGILLEYQLPLSSRRIDCMVCGRDGQRVDNAVIVELKQWERCEPAEADKLVNSGSVEVAAMSYTRPSRSANIVSISKIRTLLSTRS